MQIDEASSVPGSSGTLVHGVEARVIDLETKEDLGHNQQGEILVRNTLARFAGYKDNAEANIISEYSQDYRDDVERDVRTRSPDRSQSPTRHFVDREQEGIPRPLHRTATAELDLIDEYKNRTANDFERDDDLLEEARTARLPEDDDDIEEPSRVMLPGAWSPEEHSYIFKIPVDVHKR